MFCENCGKNYANVRYTQIINGEKKEMFLCDECSDKLGIKNFNIPIDVSSFFSDFFKICYFCTKIPKCFLVNINRK